MIAINDNIVGVKPFSAVVLFQSTKISDKMKFIT